MVYNNHEDGNRFEIIYLIETFIGSVYVCCSLYSMLLLDS